MKIIKLASKILILCLVIISAKTNCAPVSYLVCRKAGAIVVLIGDVANLPSLKNVPSALTAENTQALMKFIGDLSRITTKSNFIIPLPLGNQERNEGYKAHYKNLSENNESLNAVLYLATNSPIFNNMTFLKYNHDPSTILDFASDYLSRITYSSGSKLDENTFCSMTFSKYIEFLQERKIIFSKYIKKKDFKAETKDYINSIIKSYDALLKEFEQNEIITFFKSKGIQQLSLGYFLKVLDEKSERTKRADLSILLDYPIQIGKKRWLPPLRPEFEKIEINWLNTLSQMNTLNSYILKFLILKEILISTNNKNLTISYLPSDLIEKDIFEVLSREFETIDNIPMSENYISPNEKMLKSILANLSSTDLIRDYSSSSESCASTITSSRSGISSMYKYLIKKEIDENKNLLFIKDCLQETKIGIDLLLYGRESVNLPLTKHKMTLLMLAACAKPSAPKLINLLLEFGASSDVKIEDNEINRKDVRSFIGYRALEFAKLYESNDAVALLNLDYLDQRVRLKELVKLMNTGDLFTKCAECKVNETDEKLSFCAKCKKLKYCSPECQEKHWNEVHKKECKAWAKIDLSIFLVPEEKAKTESISKTGPTIAPPDESVTVSAESDPNLAAANSAASLAAARPSAFVAAAAAAIAATRPAAGPKERYEEIDIATEELLVRQALRESMASTKSSAAKSGISASIAGGSLSSHSSSVHTSREESKEVKVEVDLARSTAIEQPMKPSKARSKERPMKSSRSISGRSSVKASLERPTAAASVPALSAVSAAQPSAVATEQLAKLESVRKASILAKPKAVAGRPAAVARPTPVAAAAAAIAAASPPSAAAETPTTLEVDHGKGRVGPWTKHVGREKSLVRQSKSKQPKSRTASQIARDIAANTVKPSTSESTGRTMHNNKTEEKAMQLVKLLPTKGVRLGIPLGDSRWAGHAGWNKWEQRIGRVVIHYNGNVDGRFEDFKFKD